MSDAQQGSASRAAADWSPDLRRFAVGLYRSLPLSALRSPEAMAATARSARRSVFPGDGRDVELADARNEAVEWLLRAQDATGKGGISRSYSLVLHRYLGERGWQASYPETTGYIIPTLFLAAKHLDRPELVERAVRAADWEVELQLPSGGVMAGVVGQLQPAPAVFNTGQVLLGWICAFRETDSGVYADAGRKAADYIAGQIRSDGGWAGEDAPVARKDATLYNARTSWALAEAGALFGSDRYTDAAARNLQHVVAAQHDNGWMPRCCLTDPERPLLHTLAYAYRGLLEGGRVLADSSMIRAAERGGSALAERVSDDGSMAGRFASDWSEAAKWSCLTGEAQMCNVWLRLAEITGESDWREPVPRTLRHLARVQDRTTGNPGVRGGIPGSSPVWGDYGSYEILNWATKFFVDALIRFERASTSRPPDDLPGHLTVLP